MPESTAVLHRLSMVASHRCAQGYRAGVSESVRVVVAFRWSEVGSIALDPAGKLAFPSLTREPGMYRLAIIERAGTTAVYVGEADDLRRRFAHYRNPGTTQPTKKRINAPLPRPGADGRRGPRAVGTR